MSKIKVYLYIFRLCLRSFRRLNLGDVVVMDGERFFLTQGVNDPLWHLHNVTTNARLEYVDKSKFHKERSLSNYWRSFKSTWSFYMGYWFRIWLNDPSQMRDWSRQR